MSDKILYAGDTRLDAAASYLAGVLTHFGLRFDYLASDQPIAEKLAKAKHALYLLSDYPVKNFAPGDFDVLMGRVRDGAGLLMIGGWESFHGAAGEYHRSPLADALPVEMADRDDRVNFAQCCMIEKLADHPILLGLPWDRPPAIGGYNRFAPKAGAQVLLAARPFLVEYPAGGQEPGRRGVRWRFSEIASDPLLVVGQFGRGRAAAFACDAAPHWVGPLVDWGDSRVTACAPGGHEVEVGNHYARFFRQLVAWTMNPLD